MEKMSSGVRFLLNRDKVSLKKAKEKGWVRQNAKGIWVLTGKGNKRKQTGSSHPKKWLGIR